MTYTVRTFQYATIVNVVDGDTCDVEIDLGFNVRVKQRFRLANIDTPERGQPDWEASKAFLEQYIGHPITVISTKIDKYGRYLAELLIGDESINHKMLVAGLAKLYGS